MLWRMGGRVAYNTPAASTRVDRVPDALSSFASEKVAIPSPKGLGLDMLSYSFCKEN